MYKSLPSDNILKLRELTEHMIDVEPKKEHLTILKKIKNIVDEGRNEFVNTKSSASKNKAYEKILNNISNLLINIK